MNLAAKIEAILFWKGEAVSVKNLVKLLAVPESEIEAAINALAERLSGRGITLVKHADTIALTTSPEVSSLIGELTREELDRDLGKAGLETLAAIVYKGPISRSNIDYIRGVNSSFIVRHLMIRGLIERLPSPTDSRIILYQPTMELVQYLGLKSLSDLPEYHSLRTGMGNLSTEKNDQK